MEKTRKADGARTAEDAEREKPGVVQSGTDAERETSGRAGRTARTVRPAARRGRVIWMPQPRQRDFLSRGEDEALYGGAAGGGKSEALVVEALRQIDLPTYRGLILRKTYPELSELVDKSRRYYPVVCPGARWSEARHEWAFPSGAKISFGAMQYPNDRFKYQGLSLIHI